ncbi:MAG: TerD family protein, partial [Erysipelotrichaceae bacterium]|nr:TerD family protein [Erysipelotrichaceae bacterium]
LTLIIVLAHQNGDETVHKFKTATDVLRYAVKLSDGDSSLSSRCWFRHFTRSEARLILDSLEAIHERALEEDIMRRPEEFKRLMEGIHINSERYSKRYPKIYEVMKRVYSNDIHETYNARLERYFNNDEIAAAAKHLMRRPGEMARSLDRLLRMARNDEERLDFIELFAAKTEQIPTKLLWELSKYFENRQKGAPRIAMVKSANAFIPVRLPDFKTSWQFSDVVYDRLQEVLKEGIRAQYATRDKLKYVMCDNQLESYLMPTANRSTESALKPLTRGTRMKVSDNANILRLFLYWQGKDVDLSVVLANKDFSKVTNISWENSFRSDYFKPKDVVHSGDITYAKHGAAEFVDLNIQSMKQSMPDIKYAIMFVYSFSKIPFNRIEKCYAGVMERTTMGKRKYYRSRIDECQGNIYEAKTVKIKANLTSSSLSVIPLAYDFETNEVIWLDAASNADDYSISRSSVERARTTLDYFSVQRKPNIHEVIMANVEARDGTLVAKCTIMDEEGNEYDVWCKAKTNELLDISDDEVSKFSLDEGITPCDLEELLTNYL